MSIRGGVADILEMLPAEKEIIEAGVKLQQARRTFGAGLFLNLIGGGLIAGSGFTSNPKAQLGLLVSGAVTSFVGSIVMLTAVIPVGAAGEKLQKVRFPRSIRVEVQ